MGPEEFQIKIGIWHIINEYWENKQMNENPYVNQLHQNRFQIAKHWPGLNIKTQLLFKVTAKRNLETRGKRLTMFSLGIGEHTIEKVVPELCAVAKVLWLQVTKNPTNVNGWKFFIATQADTHTHTLDYMLTQHITNSTSTTSSLWHGHWRRK